VGLPGPVGATLPLLASRPACSYLHGRSGCQQGVALWKPCPLAPRIFALWTRKRGGLGIIDLSPQTPKVLRRRPKDVLGESAASGVVIFTATVDPVTAEEVCGIA
jgi:hypothetical protein